jgi:hypothetical protein
LGSVQPADNSRVEIVPVERVPSDELAVLEQKEQLLSHQYSSVHAQIDRLSGRAALDEEQFAWLDELKELEGALSLEHRNLHKRIETLRAETGLPLGHGRDLTGVA